MTNRIPKLTKRTVEALKASDADTVYPPETVSSRRNFHRLHCVRMGHPRTLEIDERLNVHIIRFLVAIGATIGIQPDWISHHQSLETLVERGNVREAVEELQNDLDLRTLRVLKDLTP